MTYEFECGECGEIFERKFKMSEEHKCKCPKCDSDKTKKIISSCNFALRGGGWYKDGYYSSVNKMKECRSCPDDA
jgi:putative FmdB family regulatory protein